MKKDGRSSKLRKAQFQRRRWTRGPLTHLLTQLWGIKEGKEDKEDKEDKEGKASTFLLSSLTAEYSPLRMAAMVPKRDGLVVVQ